MDYRGSGVDVEAGRAFVERIRSLVHRTHRSEVIGGLGGFGGYFQLPTGYKEPVLVSGADGVGTKLKLAFDLDCHHTIGIDLVAMCANDVLTSGAEPLFFLDYLATGQLDKDRSVRVVAGIAEGCQMAGCTLLGGETAEMPGFYPVGVYDLAGFCVGIVEKSLLLDGSQVQVGDVAIGLASTGVHSNGFSLIRNAVDRHNFQWSDRPSRLGGQTLGEVLLAPTRIYVKPILAARAAGLEIRGMAHVTGGGMRENLPRCLGSGQSIQVDFGTWQIPPIFEWIAEVGEVSQKAMFETFNMGIGYMLLVPASAVERAIAWFESRDISAFAIGRTIVGEGGVVGLPD